MNFEHDKDKDNVTFGMGADGHSGYVSVRARENGDVFDLKMKPLIEEKNSPLNIDSDHEHHVMVLKELLYSNYETKFGTWEWDPTDGDLRFAIELPLEDAKMTSKQFKRILSGVNNAIEYIDHIKKILETGVVPEKKDENARIISIIEQLLATAKSSESDSSFEDGI